MPKPGRLAFTSRGATVDSHPEALPVRVGHVFLVDGSYGSCGLMTLRQQFKISRDQISRLKIINHKVRIYKD